MFPGWGQDRVLLKQGVRGWNALRHAHPSSVPNLSAVDLEGAELSRADLRRADLRGAYLSGANLAGADLNGADLRRAHLTDANLRGADLRHADLRGADLRDANLRGARLEGASLARTVLDPARWAAPLLQLWREACDEDRARLIQALESKTAIHRAWMRGPAACPEAILSGHGAQTDDFSLAWDTYGISEDQVLQVLRAATSPVPAVRKTLVAGAA